jgi:outer membrane protein assembly factor BamB
LNQRSGDIVWKSDNSDDAGYATPVLTTLHEQSLALILSGKAIHAVDPATGTPRWEHRWITRYGVNAADPLLSGTDLFLSSGYAKGSSLLRISPTGAEEVWRTRDLRNQLSPGVLIDGHVYAVDGDAGEDCRLKCVEAATGVVRWEAEGLGSASLIACGPRLIILTGTGELVVDEVDSAAFRPLARAQILEGKCWTPPAFSDGRLYCRNAAGNVVCLDLRPQRLVGAASPRVNRAR